MALHLRAIRADITTLPDRSRRPVAISSVREAAPRVLTVEDVIFCCFSASDLAVYERLLIEEPR